MIKNILTVSALAIFGAAAYADEPMTRDAVVAAAKDGIEFVGNTYVQERRTENPDLILIDVRTENEYELGHIPDAIWIPRGRVEFEVAEKVRDAETEIIVYCKTGSRAALVKKALDAQGYQSVVAHEGFETWAQAGQPLENDLGVLQLIDGKTEE
tara:strand:+ start:1814 stop:2278 length:465 start_codon:yes stop_codon:yes gene_type:complete